MPSTTTRTYPHMLKVKHKIWLNHRAQRICWRQKTSGLPYTWRFLHGALQMAQISGASKGPVLCYGGDSQERLFSRQCAATEDLLNKLLIGCKDHKE